MHYGQMQMLDSFTVDRTGNICTIVKLKLRDHTDFTRRMDVNEQYLMTLTLPISECSMLRPRGSNFFETCLVHSAELKGESLDYHFNTDVLELPTIIDVKLELVHKEKTGQS